MAAYLTFDEFKARTLMPSADVDALNATEPGWIVQQLDSWSRRLDASLAKRYPVPFPSPFPEAVKEWLCRLVTVRAYLKRGVDATDSQWVTVKEDGDVTIEEVKQAADGAAGLFELPVSDAGGASAVTKGAPKVYSEASPYVWRDRQRDTARDEDAQGSGTDG